MGLGAKWIINYLDVPDKWPIKLGTNLSQYEISALELGGFVLDDKIPLERSAPTTVVDVPDSKDAVGATFVGSEDLGNVLPDPLKFNLGQSRSSMMSFSNQLEPSLDGDKRPTIRDGRPIQFVFRSSPDHLKKMESSRSISCSIMNFVRFLAWAMELYSLTDAMDLWRERSCMRCQFQTIHLACVQILSS